MAQTGSRSTGAQSTPPAAPEQTKTEPEQTKTEAKTDADWIRELEAENGRLREQLAAAGTPAPSRVPNEPSFRFSEGQRDELERTGRTVSPFTGKRYVGTPGDAREATAEEFNKAKPPAKKS